MSSSEIRSIISKIQKAILKTDPKKLSEAKSVWVILDAITR